MPAVPEASPGRLSRPARLGVYQIVTRGWTRRMPKHDKYFKRTSTFSFKSRFISLEDTATKLISTRSYEQASPEEPVLPSLFGRGGLRNLVVLYAKVVVP